MSRPSEIETLEVVVALAQGSERIAGRLVLLDEVVPDASRAGSLQHRTHVDGAVAGLAERGSRHALVVALLRSFGDVLHNGIKIRDDLF